MNQPLYCELYPIYHPSLEVYPYPQNNYFEPNYYQFSTTAELFPPVPPVYEPPAQVAVFPVNEPVPLPTHQLAEPSDKDCDGPPVLHLFGVSPEVVPDSFFDETIIIKAGPVFDNEVVVFTSSSSNEQSEVINEPQVAEVSSTVQGAQEAQEPTQKEVTHCNIRRGAKVENKTTTKLNTRKQMKPKRVTEPTEKKVDLEEKTLRIEPDNQQCIQSFFGCTYEISLMESWKWKRLHEIGNEMKCSVNGLSISPELSFKVSGVEGNSRYRIGIRLVRQKFGINKSEEPVPIISDEIKSKIVSGRVIMEKGIQMKDLKIYREDGTEESEGINRWNMFLVVPDNNYLPYVTLYKVSIAGAERTLVSNVKFKETEFRVVTRYTNPRLARLCIEIEEHELRMRETAREIKQTLLESSVTSPEPEGHRSSEDSRPRSPSVEITSMTPGKRAIQDMNEAAPPKKKRSRRRSPSIEIVHVQEVREAGTEVISSTSSNDSPVRIHLENKSEWRKFHRKSGRMKCSEEGTFMSPILQYKFFGLSPTDRYKIGIKLVSCSNDEADQGDSNEFLSRTMFGKRILKKGVAMDEIRLFHASLEMQINSVIKKKQLQVVPQVQYLPSLTLYKVSQTGQMEVEVSGVIFKQTGFLAVTELDESLQIWRRTYPKRDASRRRRN